MDRYLKVTTEVNGERVVAHRRCFLEYPEDENHEYLYGQSVDIVAKLTGLSRTKIKEAHNFFWDYEDYNEEKHGHLDCVDMDEVYNTQFYNS